MKKLPIIFLLFCFAGNAVFASRILYFYVFPSRSHNIWHTTLISSLLKRGHEITLATMYPTKKENLTVFEVEFNEEADNMDFEEMHEENPFISNMNMFDLIFDMTKDSMEDKAIKHLLQFVENKSFDLVLYEHFLSEWVLAFLPKLGYPPTIAVSPYVRPFWLPYQLGNPDNPAYIPVMSSMLIPPMNLYERMWNTICNLQLNSLYRYQFIPRVENHVKKLFNEPDFSLEKSSRNMSLVLLNTWPILAGALPFLPSIIPVGGLHIAQPKPLPSDLEKFVSGAKHGFIFFSMGSFLKSTSLDPKKCKMLMDAFAELPQRIVWKFEKSELPGKPDNVMISPWLPQNDILAHPNIKLFISHSGLLSSQEAIYHGVPIVGLPMVFDQKENMARLLKLKIAEKLEYSSLSKEIIISTVRKVIENPSYKVEVNKLSKIVRDQPQHPLDRAVFWVEYVLRHKGAPHLRAASADMPLYQYLLLDVFAFLLAVLFVSVFIVVKIVKLLFVLIFARSDKNKKVKTN